MRRSLTLKLRCLRRSFFSCVAVIQRSSADMFGAYICGKPTCYEHAQDVPADDFAILCADRVCCMGSVPTASGWVILRPTRSK